MNDRKLRLGVNIDHIASLRQARGTSYPSLLDAANDCKRGGADGITVHLREDRRHVQDSDVYALGKSGILPLNLEMADCAEILSIAVAVKPAEACLVPEKRMELTTEGGLNVVSNFDSVASTVARLKECGITVSLFIDPDADQVDAAARAGSDCVELHTGDFCGFVERSDEKRAGSEMTRLAAAARLAHEKGMQVNAGHGLTLDSVAGIVKAPFLDTLNIGHSIVCRSVFIGLENAVREMVRALNRYDGGTA